MAQDFAQAPSGLGEDFLFVEAGYDERKLRRQRDRRADSGRNVRHFAIGHVWKWEIRAYVRLCMSWSTMGSARMGVVRGRARRPVEPALEHHQDPYHLTVVRSVLADAFVEQGLRKLRLDDPARGERVDRRPGELGERLVA